MKTSLALLLVALLGGVAAAQDNVLLIRGRGAEGHKPYHGGKVEFLGVDLLDQLVNYTPGRPLPIRLRIRYRVLEPAPVLLDSRLGTEYWRLYCYTAERFVALHSRERIDLSKPGEAETTTDRMTVDPKYAGKPAKGLVGFRGHYYFLVDQPNGQWLDTVTPPPFFLSRKLAAKLTFTLADLSKYELSVPEVKSTWEPGGPLRFRVEVTDAAGKRFPVVNGAGEVSGGDWHAVPATQFDPLGIPSGWLEVKLPKHVPDTVTVTVKVSAMTPAGPQKRTVSRTFKRGEGKVALSELERTEGAPPVVRNAAGVIRETRALWVAERDILTKARIDDLVRRAKEARLNVLLPNITTRRSLAAKSDLFPLDPHAEKGLDPLGYLIRKAHAAGLEVDPWFTCTYRDAKGRQEIGGGVDIIDRHGKVVPLGADEHRPAYRDWIVKLMIGIARDYPVDGIHFDYIRVMHNCYCDACRKEFQAQYGKPLTDATPAEWQAWNRQAIGDVVQRVAKGVRAVRPKAILSAAVFSNLSSGALQGQDPGGWANRGWLDAVMPMDYNAETLLVRSNEREFLKILHDPGKLVTGLSLYVRNGTRAVGRDPALVAQQIRLVRQMGIHGYCLFVSSFLDGGRLAVLRNEVNREPAVPWWR